MDQSPLPSRAIGVAGVSRIVAELELTPFWDAPGALLLVSRFHFLLAWSHSAP